MPGRESDRSGMARDGSEERTDGARPVHSGAAETKAGRGDESGTEEVRLWVLGSIYWQNPKVHHKRCINIAG